MKPSSQIPSDGTRKGRAAEMKTILFRYRQFRAIARQHHRATRAFLTGDALLGCARELGLGAGTPILFEYEEDACLLMDLALHTASPGRSRAVDRFARASAFPAGSDDSLMAHAKCRTRFSIWAVEGRHPEIGLILVDVIDAPPPRGGMTARQAAA